jgi:N-acetyl-beta-hexosaminidase
MLVNNYRRKLNPLCAVAGLIFACHALLFAQSDISLQPPSDAVRALHVLPAPKYVRLESGGMTIKASTVIFITHEEDRNAAEGLQEEIVDRGGMKLSIEVLATERNTPGNILLRRSSDRSTDRGNDRGNDRGFQSSEEKLSAAPTPELATQGYVIHASDSGIAVAGETAQGVFYGVQTLRQLLRPRAAQRKDLEVPSLTIRDWPSMEWRGVSDDISRGPIPTLEYLKMQIRTLAEYKINLLGFNMEHVFDFKSAPLVSPQESAEGDHAALTASEIKELVSYGAKYFVTILPEQQAFGHLHQFLKFEAYSDLAETPHGHVLTPTNPQTYDFIRQIYGEIIPLFPGPFFHIGSDETFELGLGRTKTLAAQQGLGRVYLEHLQKVFEIMRPYNKQLMFWGDIAVKYPELLTILPKQMIAVRGITIRSRVTRASSHPTLTPGCAWW